VTVTSASTCSAICYRRSRRPQFASSANAARSTWSRRSNGMRDTSRASAAIPATSRSSASRAAAPKVSTLLAMPAARGRSQGEFVMSGSGDPAGRARARNTAGRGGAARGRHAPRRARPGCRPCRWRSCTPRSIRRRIDRPVRPAAVRPQRVGPMVDGTVVPSQPFDPAARRCPRQVPVLVAAPRTRWRSIWRPTTRCGTAACPKPSSRRASARSRRPTERVLATYRRLHPDMNPASA